MALLANLLGDFYRYNLPCFPVVESLVPESKSLAENNTSTKENTVNTSIDKLIGFLPKNELNRWTTDIARLSVEYKKIPEILIQKSKISSVELLKKLTHESEIPVLDIKGHIVAHWDERQFLQALSQSPQLSDEKSKITIQQSNKENPKNDDTVEKKANAKYGNSRWLGELILQAFPWPMYACDLQGKTLFFNKLFEKNILTKKKMKNSIRQTENYLFESVCNLLAQSYSQETPSSSFNKTSDSTLSYHDSFIDQYVCIIDIKEINNLHGYLFIFRDGMDPGFSREVNQCLNSKASLIDIMSELERKIILGALEKNKRNISHTAQSLYIKRSTLQNKIQRLQISKYLGHSTSDVIPRNLNSRLDIIPVAKKNDVKTKNHEPIPVKKDTKRVKKKKLSKKLTQEKKEWE